MVKAFNFFKRRPELTVERFREYWLNQHAAVIRAIPEVRGYVASIALSTSYRDNHEPLYDGISEAWFDAEETIRKISNSGALRAAATDDAVFADMSKAGSIITDEVVQKQGTPGKSAVKIFSLLTRKPGMDVAAFQSYWRTRHGPLAAKIPQTLRYVQCHVRPSGYSDGRTPRYDGVAEVWFADFQAVRDSGNSDLYQAVRADEQDFLSVPFPLIFASEHRIV
ncbi:MAG: EthD domain-containing protein [Candidatus Binatus sp.]